MLPNLADILGNYNEKHELESSGLINRFRKLAKIINVNCHEGMSYFTENYL